MAEEGKLKLNRFYIFCIAVWFLAHIWACHNLFPVFYGLTPKKECEDPGFQWSKKQCSLSKQQQCVELKNCSTIFTIPPDFRSMVEDFDLTCDRSYFSAVVTTLQFAGVLVGALVYGHLGDHFGRKPVSLVGIGLGMLTGIASGFAPNWQLFALCRFVIGTSMACVIVVFYTYNVELLLPEHRLLMRTITGWGPARTVFTLICWLTGWWRTASIASSALLLPVFLAVLIFFPESPIWYQTKNRINDANTAKNKVRRMAGIPEEEEIFVPQSKDVDNHVYTVKDLFAEKKLGKMTAVLAMLWFSTSLMSYSNELNAGNLGSFYFNQFIVGISTMVVQYGVFFVDTYLGSFNRRRLHQIPQFVVLLCFASLMALLIIPHGDCDQKTWWNWTVIIFNIIGTAAMTLVWDACYLVAAEVFPTNLRSVGVGICSLMARVGAIAAPQMAFLSRFSMAAPYGVVITVGCLSLIISILFLPNTKGVDLSDPEVAEEEMEKRTFSASIIFE